MSYWSGAFTGNGRKILSIAILFLLAVMDLAAFLIMLKLKKEAKAPVVIKVIFLVLSLLLLSLIFLVLSFGNHHPISPPRNLQASALSNCRLTQDDEG
ncbi:MAG: hypothetical protein LBQ15_02460 [Clostridium sp.]|jgi:phosphoglycerol transferase MdoB-like AlkP superfamily enzyme|nr:hypothetical protein [Clostridium sp.]